MASSISWVKFVQVQNRMLSTLYSPSDTNKRWLLLSQILIKPRHQVISWDVGTDSPKSSLQCVFKQEGTYLHSSQLPFHIMTHSHFAWKSQYHYWNVKERLILFSHTLLKLFSSLICSMALCRFKLIWVIIGSMSSIPPAYKLHEAKHLLWSLAPSPAHRTCHQTYYQWFCISDS